MLLLSVLKQFQAMPNVIAIKTADISVRAWVGNEVDRSQLVLLGLD
jgi:hypothetical protein